MNIQLSNVIWKYIKYKWLLCVVIILFLLRLLLSLLLLSLILSSNDGTVTLLCLDCKISRNQSYVRTENVALSIISN